LRFAAVNSGIALIMLALLSTPIRRWILAALLLPVVAFVLAKIGGYLQRRNGGQPTRISRALLSVSSFLNRRSARRRGIESSDSKQNAA
jgi:hypothetical protein